MVPLARSFAYRNRSLMYSNATRGMISRMVRAFSRAIDSDTSNEPGLF